MVPPTYRVQPQGDQVITNPNFITSGFGTNNKEFEGRGFIISKISPANDCSPA